MNLDSLAAERLQRRRAGHVQSFELLGIEQVFAGVSGQRANELLRSAELSVVYRQTVRVLEIPLCAPLRARFGDGEGLGLQRAQRSGLVVLLLPDDRLEPRDQLVQLGAAPARRY